jgi:hypothetical protein
VKWLIVGFPLFVAEIEWAHCGSFGDHDYGLILSDRKLIAADQQAIRRIEDDKNAKYRAAHPTPQF